MGQEPALGCVTGRSFKAIVHACNALWRC